MSELNEAPLLRRLVSLWSLSVDGYPVTLAWSPDGSLLAVAAAEGTVHLFDTDGRSYATLAGHAMGVLDLSWSRDGSRLVTGGQDGVARIWRPDGTCTATLDHGKQWVQRARFAPHAPQLVTAAGRQLRFWGADGEPLLACEPEDYTIEDCQWLDDGTGVVTCAYGAARIWRAANVRAVQSYAWHGALLAVATSPRGHALAAGLQEAGLHYWRMTDGDALYMRGYATKVRELSWDADGRYLASGGGASVVIWDCTGSGPAGTEPLVLDLHVKPITALAFAPRGSALASGSRDGSAVVIGPETEDGAGSLVRDSPVSELAWNPDGSRVAFAFEDGHIAVCPGAGASG